MKKVFRAIALALSLIIVLSGCKLGENDVYLSTGNGLSNAFTIGTLKCPKKEANLYIACVSDYYGNVGDESRLKDSALAIMTRVYSLNLYAEENDLKLTEEELERVNVASKNFFVELSSEDKTKLNLSQKDIYDAYEKYGLALKVYDSLMEGVDNDVTEDQSRVMEAYVIYLTDGTNVSEIESRIKKNDDFATLTQVYSEGNKRIINFGRDVYPKEFDDVVFSLEDGEISGKIDTDEGIYYVKCINKYLPERSEENKAIIIDKRQKALIKQIETEQSENYFSDINSTFFDGIETSAITLENGGKFFETIEKELKFTYNI